MRSTGSSSRRRGNGREPDEDSLRLPPPHVGGFNLFSVFQRLVVMFPGRISILLIDGSLAALPAFGVRPNGRKFASGLKLFP